MNMSSKIIKALDGDDDEYNNASSAAFSDGLSQTATNKELDDDGGYNDDDESTATAHGNSTTNKERKEVLMATKRTYVVAILVILGGIVSSLCFLYVGISSNRTEQQTNFERHAQDLSKEIISSFRDYETAAAWIHESCRNWRNDKNEHGGNSCTRHDFRVLYNYLIDGGLDFFLAEWVPNITHSERESLEMEATNYYSNDTNVNYNGFVGLGSNPTNPDEFGLFPRPQQPYYFPIQYLEPYERIGEAVHLDLYSIVYEREAIDLALSTFEPVLTERFVIVSQETDGYSVSLIHPGVQLPDDIYKDPKDLSLLLIHIRSLIARAARHQGVSLQVYLYDATQSKSNTTYPQEYLGGAKIEVSSVGDDVEDDDETRQITYCNETEYDDVRMLSSASSSAAFSVFDTISNTLFYEQSMKAGQRDWTIVVMPVDSTSYQPNNLFALLCGVMIFAASLLLAWIWIIHNRKRRTQVENIINKAAAESAIVSSLFPAAIRDRLIQNQQEQQNGDGTANDYQQRNHTTKTSSSPTSSEHDNDDHHDVENRRRGPVGFLVSKTTVSSDYDEALINKGSEGSINDGNMPIAMLYQETTILFADLAGFTFWSSKRQPQTVFKLLETFYQAFDEIAKRRKVFKVETIGDCYVAVTGIPNEQPKHATIMAVFATECMNKMKQLVGMLAGELGEDTLNLQMRVGLNSGSVTAGVLRGDKSRFQLFGDSVNTASRMESNGVKGRIHCSQTTADALVQACKGHWLTRREDKIVAKGKGEMQTYWVNTTAHHRRHHHHHYGGRSHDTTSAPSSPSSPAGILLPEKGSNKHDDQVDVEDPSGGRRINDQEQQFSDSDSGRSSSGDNSGSKIVKGTIASYCG